MGTWYETLESFPTIRAGQTCDLKVDIGGRRIWLARTTKDDGEVFDHSVYIEELQDGQWIEVAHFDGDELLF